MQAKSTKNNTRKSKRPKGTIKKIRKTLRLPNNRTKRANVIRGKKIAAASALTMKKRFTVLRQQGNSVRVTGRDLIYPIPDSLVAPIQTTNVIAVIPANPVYWSGTRIAALASGYQNYRPIKFKVNYIPICAVTQQGNVIGGTIWDDGIANDSIQQSLRTSNGGFLTQCYTPHSTSIRPKSNLPFNLYKIGGDFQQTNPFIFIAIAIGCTNNNNQRIIPGYFYVTWSFELKNPIGSTNQFYNTGLITYSQLQPKMNNTIINLSTNSEIPFGAYVNVEIEDTTKLVPYYNDTPITVASETPTWAFQSISRATTTTITTKIPINYTGLTTNRALELEATDTGTQSTYTIFEPEAYLIDSGDKYTIWEPETATRSTAAPAKENFTWRAPTPADIYYSLAPQQMLGTFKNTGVATIQGKSYTSTLTYNIYEASKEYFTIQLLNTSKPINNEAKYIHFAQPKQPLKQQQDDNHNQEDDIKTEEDNIIHNYLDQEDIHNEKDLEELENRIKLLRIKNNKNQQ